MPRAVADGVGPSAQTDAVSPDAADEDPTDAVPPDDAECEFADDELDDVELGAVNFDGLSPTDFEEFCFDLLEASGFQNVEWRKGTPLPSSPADRGRDIEAEQERVDVDGHRYSERWFVDCKHYTRGVPPDPLSSSLAWAAAERPATMLFIASGYLTNPAKDYLADYERNNRPSFRIHVWELPQLRKLLVDRLDVAFRHNVGTPLIRRISDVLAIEQELPDRSGTGASPIPPIRSPKTLPGGRRRLSTGCGALRRSWRSSTGARSC
jgi:hypothetical protein